MMMAIYIVWIIWSVIIYAPYLIKKRLYNWYHDIHIDIPILTYCPMGNMEKNLDKLTLNLF